MHILPNEFVSVIAAMSVLLVAGCGSKDDPVSSSGGDKANLQDTVTYTAEIKPLLDSRCIGCHSTALSGAARNGAPSGVNFNTYSDAAANASKANSRIQAGTMPPTGGLPQSERDLFQQWLNTGLEQ